MAKPCNCCGDGGGVQGELLPHILGTHLVGKLLLSAARHYFIRDYMCCLYYLNWMSQLSKHQMANLGAPGD